MPKSTAGPRRRARRLALQALFEADSVGHDAAEVLDRLLAEESLTEENASFARDLVSGVVGHVAAIDRQIERYAPAWPMKQMPAVDRNVLRLAIFEVFLDNKLPAKIGINEAIELAKAFGSDNSPKFINGVLGSIVLKLKDNSEKL
jgi:transcription antitermination protein NusB